MQQPNLHVVACVAAIIIGVAVYANVLHVATLHAAVGLIVVIGAVLALV